jgi:hypothetical protein
MQRKLFKTLDGQLVRLRPPVHRQDGDGSYLPWVDDLWRVDARFPVKGAVARLTNIRTMHLFDVFGDGVQEFRAPDVVFVRSQLTLKGNEVLREELADRRLAYAGSRVRKQNA